MNALTSVYDRWSHPSYERRVRGAPVPATTFLWGSAWILKPIPFDKPPILHLRNDLFGDPVIFGTVASGVQTEIGTLQPGECISIPLQGITGVFAFCPSVPSQIEPAPATQPGQSVVACLIRE
jgi:hypothetical protein